MKEKDKVDHICLLFFLFGILLLLIGLPLMSSMLPVFMITLSFIFMVNDIVCSIKDLLTAKLIRVL